MKVLENNYDKINQDVKSNYDRPYPRKHICEQCNSKLEYDKSDLRIGYLGKMYLDCPLCGFDNMIEDNEQAITLTKDNIEFPIHFFHASKESGAVDCCNNDEIKKSINKAIDFFRKNKEEFVWSTESGNLYMSVWRCDGDRDYYVVVANNYYSTYIPFEEKD